MFVLVLFKGKTGVVFMVDVTFLARVAVAGTLGGCASGVVACCALLATSGGAWRGGALLGCEERHEFGGLGKEFLLLGFKQLEAVVLCRSESGGMLLSVFECSFETVWCTRVWFGGRWGTGFQGRLSQCCQC